MRQGEEIKGKIKNAAWLAFSVMSLCFFSPNAYAQVSITQPVSHGVTSPYGMRTHPITGNASVHTGIDYGTPCGTNIPTGSGTLACGMQAGGWGLYGKTSYACGVETISAHLSSCDRNGTFISGGAKGNANSGSSTGCHLHFEIWINGARINPPSAYGKDLCNEATRKELIEEAQRLSNGQAGGGGGSYSGSNTPQPPPNSNDNVQSVVEVPTGGKDPVTGVINTGPSYYVVKTTDGRTYNEYSAGGDEPFTGITLPPTTSDIVPAGSSNNEVTGCGTDTWRAMVNQAVLQTRREMLMNQRYIVKPDSVLSYSCFSSFIDRARQTLGVFSETKYWVNREIDILDGSVVKVNVELGQYSLDGALSNAALQPYERFLTLYNYDYLGGQLASSAGSGGGHEHEESNSWQAYAPCGTMDMVWQQAKCMNVTDDPMFYRFTELIGNDPRKYPPNYACNDSGIFQNMIDIAQNKSAEFSKVVTHFDLLKPPGNTCAPPIPTGVTVTTREGADRLTREFTYPDGLCITPGCSYQKNGTGADAGTCEIKQPRLGSS